MITASMSSISTVAFLLIVQFQATAVLADDIAVSGPITAGKKGGPFSAPIVDLAERGYQMAEYFLKGTATGYEFVPDNKKTVDGLWKVRSRGEAVPYTTRILVVRPIEQKDFNGTVILHWQNVTAGYELGTVGDNEYLRGYTWIGVSAQKIGIDGFAGPNAAGLRQWDPDRYGSLDHPGDAYSYDIFTQAALVVAPDRQQRKNDPMAGLRVERLVAAGASQSASRLWTYINGVHPLVDVMHGFMPYIGSGGTIPFDADRLPRGERRRFVRAPTQIRADLNVPVFIVNSETETLRYAAARQPDNEKFRLWEIAGSSHVSVPRRIPGDPDAAPAREDLQSPNWHSYFPAYFAALRHMHVWLTDGTPPPVTAKIRIKSGEPSAIVKDKHGNALGGIRLPDFAVPTAELRGRGTSIPGGYRLAFLFGYARDFSNDELKALYGNEKSFRATYEKAIEASIEEGVLLKEDVAGMRDRAYRWIKGRL